MRLIYERQLAAFEALRRLGFSPDDIFFGFNGGRPVVVLSAQAKEFITMIDGDVPATDEQYRAEWLSALTAWNTSGSMTEQERKRIFDVHILETGASVALVQALLSRGFRLDKNFN